MISREALAAALTRLDPRDWEVLDLSLRRRVPDEALAKLFDSEPAEVARRRAAAIEHLAEALGVQRGEDLGAVLKALLDAETWEAADDGESWRVFSGPPIPPEPGQAEAGQAEPVPAELGLTEPDREPEPKTSEAARLFRLTPAPDPVAAAEPPPAEAEPQPAGPEPRGEPEPQRAGPRQADPARGVTPAAEAPAAEAPAADDDAPAADDDAPAADGGAPGADGAPSAGRSAVEEAGPPAATPAILETDPGPVFAPTNGSELPKPVLDMLAEREEERRRGDRLRSPFVYALAGGLGAAGLLALGWFGATQFDGDSGGRSSAAGDDGTRRFLPERGGPLAAPFPSDPRTTSCYSTAYVRRATVVYSRPGGRRKLKLPATTEWGSPRVLSVVRKRGDWLAVLAPELKNGEVAWMEASRASRIDCVRWSLHVDLSRRRLYVRRDGRTIRKLRVAIGSKAHPTPRGRFAVTDKLKVTDKGSPYGCCVLALTGHQTKLPPDWPGGDRLAVHATTDLSSIGKPVSLGCMRSSPSRVRWLIKQVPLGAPVFIRA